MQTSSQSVVDHDVLDLALAETGKRRIESALQSLPVLQTIRKQFITNQPFAGVRIAACIPLTAESACLILALRDGGASLAACSSDPAAADDVAASLVRDYGVSVYTTQATQLARTLAHEPSILIDDCGDLIRAAESSAGITGAVDHSSRARTRATVFPIVTTHDSPVRRQFENRHGLGQASVEAIIRTANVLLAGVSFVVAGYGAGGRGIAACARGLGASVTITEVDPERAAEALMDGYRVMRMVEAAAIGDIFCTVTGNENVLTRDHFEKLKNGAMLANAGLSEGEIDVDGLVRLASSQRQARESMQEFVLKDGRRVYLLALGRALGPQVAYPAAVADINCGLQALAAEYIMKSGVELAHTVYPLPLRIGKTVVQYKLESMNVKIDRLTIEQEQFLAAESGIE